MSMYCYQCEQTLKGSGCTAFGVCGKDPETASMQDLLVEVTKELGFWTHQARQLGRSDRELDVFVIEALFTTVTNVNFDSHKVEEMLRRGSSLKEKAHKLYLEAAAARGRQVEELSRSDTFEPAESFEDLIRQAEQYSGEEGPR